MKKLINMFLTVIVCISAAFPMEILAEAEGQREEVIEPYGIQEPLEPQLDPEADGEPQIQPFSQATSEEKIYSEIEERMKAALLAGESTIYVSDLQVSREKSLYNLLYYSPYFSNGIDAQFYYSTSGYYVYIRLENTMSLEETINYFQSVDSKVNEILSITSDDMNGELKALLLHDYLVYEFEYDYENLTAGTLPQDSYRSGGLFMQGRGVCQAYAYGYKYLMDRLGIECHVTTSSEMNHAWNIINIDGSYYHVDCTWDDPVYDRLGMVGHGYFLVSDEAVQEARGGTNTHWGWDRTDLVCDNTKYDQAYWEEINSQIIFKDDCSYYIRGNSIYKRDINSQEETELKNLGKWYVWGNTGSYWIGAFSGLFLYNDELFYNTASEIRKISVDGTKEALVYKPDTTEGYIYGSKKSGTEIQYVLKQSPNGSGEKQTAPVSLDIIPTGIQLDQEKLEMKVGETASLSYILVPENAAAQITWSSGNENIASIDENGTITAKTPGEVVITVKTETGLNAECRVTVIEEVYPEKEFSDVGKDDWFYEAVNYVYKNGIMSGLTTDTFGPDEQLTRSQFATILYRIEGEPETVYEPEFQDVPEYQWFTDGILWASNVGIVSGYRDNGLFGTEDPITREQMAVMMYRYGEYKEYDTSARGELDQFTDMGSLNDYAKEAVQWAVKEGIISGKAGNVLDPQGGATRGECAAIIMRFIENYK